MKARSTAASSVSSMKQNGVPALAKNASTMSASATDSTRAISPRAGLTPGRWMRVCSVSVALGTSPDRSTTTATGPTPSSNTISLRPDPDSAIASTHAVPTVGWPANGSSIFGVKMRSRQVWAASSGGSTKVVSARLNSRAMVCMAASDRPRASVSTASGLPP